MTIYLRLFCVITEFDLLTFPERARLVVHAGVFVGPSHEILRLFSDLRFSLQQTIRSRGPEIGNFRTRGPICSHARPSRVCAAR